MMRVILIILLFSTSALAQDCSKKDIFLHGNIIFKTKVLFNEFPKVWTVNGDRFSSLFIKKAKKLEVDEVIIELKSKDFNKKYKKKVSQKTNAKGFYHIEGIDFKNDILPSYSLLPITMELRFFNKNSKICEKEYSLEVVL